MMPALSPLMSIAIRVGAPVTLEPGVPGRRFVPITGGDVTGSLNGRVVAGGGDWQTIMPDGAIEIAAHYVLDIAGHGLVEVRSEGVRHAPPHILEALGRGDAVDASLYYFRTSIRLAAGAPDLLGLSRTIYVASDRREQGQVHLDIFEVH